MNVGGVQQIVETIKGLQRQQRDIGVMRDQRLQLWAKGAVAAEEKVNPRVVSNVRASGASSSSPCFAPMLPE